MASNLIVAEIPLALEGLNGTKNPSIVRNTELLQALNVTFDAGTIQKEGGAKVYGRLLNGGNESVIGGWDWHPTPSVQRMIVLFTNGLLARDTGDGTFSVNLRTGMGTLGVVPQWVDGGLESAGAVHHLFLFTGLTAVQVLDDDGVSVRDLALPPADWTGTNQPKCGVVHEGRLCGAGNGNDPHRVYMSGLDDHEDFTTASLTFSIYPGEGDGIVAMVSYKGLLVIFKEPKFTYILDTTAVATSDWKVFKASDLGTVSPLSAIAFNDTTDDQLVFLDRNGRLRVVVAINAQGKITTLSISDRSQMAPFIRDKISLANLSKARMVYYADKNELHVVLPASGGAALNRRLVIDHNTVGVPKFRFCDRDSNESIWMRRDNDGIERPTIGDDNETVFLLDQETRDKDGAGYLGQFQTAHNDLSAGNPKIQGQDKRGAFLEVVMEPKGNWNLDVDILWDGLFEQTVSFNLGVTGAALGTFILGTDALAVESIRNVKRKITGGGRRISLVARNSTAGQDFSIAKFLVHFRLGEEGLR